MEKKTEEKDQKPGEAELSSPASSLPAEDPISLNKLYPDAKQDLDALFTEPSLKKLLHETLQTRKKNERFLQKIHLPEIPSDEEEKTP